MKSSVIKSLTVLLSTLAFTGLQSCEREDPKLAPSTDKIDVSATINGMQAEAGKASRAIVSDAQWKNGSTFSMWVVPFNGTTPGVMRPAENYVDNKVYTYDLANVKFTGDVVYYPAGASKVKLYALSPSITAAPSSTTAMPFAVIADQTTIANITKSDLLTGLGEGTAGVDNGKANISFAHRMSKALVKFTLPATYAEKAITSITGVEVYGAMLNSTVNITDTTAVPVITSTIPTSIKAYQAIAPSGKVDGAYVYEALLTPGSQVAVGTSVVSIAVEVADIGPVIFHCKISGAAHTYEARQQTLININIEDKTVIALDASNVTIGVWGKTPDVSGSTSKMSKLNFDLAAVNLCSTAPTATKAVVKIEGVVYNAKVKYTAATGDTGQYVLEFDQGSNRAGNLEEVKFMTAADVVVGQLFTGLTYQIKGDPTNTSYATVIATVTFTGEAAAIITKK